MIQHPFSELHAITVHTILFSFRIRHISHRNTIIFLTLKAIVNVPSTVIFQWNCHCTITDTFADKNKRPQTGVDKCPSHDKQQTMGNPGLGGRGRQNGNHTQRRVQQTWTVHGKAPVRRLGGSTLTGNAGRCQRRWEEKASHGDATFLNRSGKGSTEQHSVIPQALATSSQNLCKLYSSYEQQGQRPWTASMFTSQWHVTLPRGNDIETYREGLYMFYGNNETKSD